jgi:hypothetical protein
LSTSSNVPLGVLRLQSRRRSDLENNPFISDPEFNDYITQSYKELYDKLVSAYGNDYYVATTYSFNTNNAQFYPLPDGTPSFTNSNGTQAEKFYKLLGVDLQYSASPSGYVSLRRFEFIERNKYAYPNTAVNWNGYSNLRYRLEGDNLFLVPIPMTGQGVRVWYIPAPTNLQFTLVASCSMNSNVFSLSDTTGLTPGMNAYITSIQQTLTVQAVGSTTVQVVGSISVPCNNTPVSFYDDAASFDGIAGWEEYVILSSAIKAKIKQEDDISGLAAQLLSVSNRIDAMSEGRDAGQAQHVSDALGMQSYGGSDGFGSGGWFGSDGW